MVLKVGWAPQSLEWGWALFNSLHSRSLGLLEPWQHQPDPVPKDWLLRFQEHSELARQLYVKLRRVDKSGCKKGWTPKDNKHTHGWISIMLTEINQLQRTTYYLIPHVRLSPTPLLKVTDSSVCLNRGRVKWRSESKKVQVSSQSENVKMILDNVHTCLWHTWKPTQLWWMNHMVYKLE